MPNTEDAPDQIPVATATALPVNHNTDYQFQRANDNTATPLLQPNPLHPTTTTTTTTTANTIVNPIQRFNTLPTNTKRITMYAFSGCCCLWMVGSAVCGWLFPGVMSFVGDIVGLFFVCLFAGVFVESARMAYNTHLGKPYHFNPLLFVLAALLYPISYGCASIVVAIVIITVQSRKGKSIGALCLFGFLLFLVTAAVFFGGLYGVWDLFFNRYCIWSPIEFTSETCSPQQNFSLPINFQLQARYLQINSRTIYDAYATPTNATDSIGEGPALAVFGQSQWQRCSAPGAPWTYQDGQSVQMWNPINGSDPFSGQWIRSADRTIIWEMAQLLPYSIYHVFNCRNQLQYIVTTQTDFSTISMFDIKIHDKDNNMLASSKQQFSWTSVSMPFTTDNGVLVGTLSQTLSMDVWRDHWNVNVRPEHQHYVEPYVYGHVASILKRSQGSHSSSSSSSSRRRRSSGSRRRFRRR
jgi:hypothetical protein